MKLATTQKPESAFEVISRLKLNSLNPGDIVGVHARERGYFFAEFSRLEFLAEDVTYLNLIFHYDKGTYPHELSMNAKYVNRVDIFPKWKILEMLNNTVIGYKDPVESGKSKKRRPKSKK